MPTINQHTQIDINLEKFLRACSDSELYELMLLLNRPEYDQRIQRAAGTVTNPDEVEYITDPQGEEVIVMQRTPRYNDIPTQP